MRRILIIIFLLFLFNQSVMGQDSLNVTRQGRWGKGQCKAVFQPDGYVQKYPIFGIRTGSATADPAGDLCFVSRLL